MTIKNSKTKTITKKLTTEEKILGFPEKVEVITIDDYEDKSKFYKVTNLEVNNKPTIVNGSVIETFIGAKNNSAREELKRGIKKVYCKNIHGENIYKIEVVE